MLHTFYSNSYDVLKALLLAQIDADFAVKSREPERFFEPERVIIPSIAVQKDLEQSIARQQGLCAGMHFELLGQFLQDSAGFSLGEGVGGAYLQWAVWSRLMDDEFVGSHPRLAHYLKGKNPLEAYRLALHVASVFGEYAGYRLDWLLEWMGAKNEEADPQARLAYEARRDREQKILAASPDYEWQRDLIASLAQPTQAPIWPEAQNLLSVPALFDRERREGRVNGKPQESLHLFAPFSLSPLALPFLRLAAEAQPAMEVFAYLYNPSSVYWFGGLPEGVAQWPEVKTEDDQADRLVMDYLRRNAASTRALIDRLWKFSSSPENVLSEEDAPGGQAPETAVRQIALERLQDLQVGSPAQTQFVYLRPQGHNLLQRLQAAVLDPTQAAELFAGQPQAKSDDSLLFVAAPTFAREVEECLNQIHGLFARMPDLQPQDILIAVPDVRTAAPIVQSVFGAQPEGSRVAWQIMGQSLMDRSVAAQAVIRLGDLLSSTATSADFFAWLSQPLSGAAWGLSLDDQDSLRIWLTSAGYRWGLTPQHVEDAIADQISAEGAASAVESCLERALERLAAGYCAAPGERVPLGDVLPVYGREDRGFFSTADKSHTFKTINSLLALLEEQRCAIRDDKSAASWGQWTIALVASFFGVSAKERELKHFHEALQSVVHSMQKVLGERKLPFAVFWAAIKDAVSAQPSMAPAAGAVTIAGIDTVRRLPYRVIFVLGVNTECGIPGSSQPEEFDLLPVLPRAGDRDSREDKRAAFLELVLAARERLILSWSEGFNASSPIHPALVVQDLQTVLTGLGVDLKTISARVPLSSWSQKSFMAREDKDWTTLGEGDARWWRSTDKPLCEAAREAQQTKHQAPPLPFAQDAAGEPLEAENGVLELAWADVKAFYSKPDEWWLARAGVKPASAQEDSDIGVNSDPIENKLFISVAQKGILRDLTAGQTPESITHALQLDPRWGALGYREEQIRDKVAMCGKVQQTREKLLGELGPEEDCAVRLDFQLGETQVVITHSEPLANKNLVRICLSGAAIARAQLDVLVLAAAGVVDAVQIINKDANLEAVRVPDQKSARQVVEILLEAMQTKAEQPLTALGPVYSSSEIEDQTALLWRDAAGFDKAVYARFQLQKALTAFFTPPKKDGDEDAALNNLLRLLEAWRQ